MIEAWADRTAELSARCPASSRSSAFENRGAEIGVTLHHPHGQIYAYPFVTAAHARRCSTRRARYRDRTGAQPVRRRARRASGGRQAGRRDGRALDGVRAGRGALAGRGAPRTRTGRCPTSPRSTDAERDDFAGSTSTCCAGSTALFGACRCRTSPPGTRRPCTPAATWPDLHLQLFSLRRAPGKLKYLAGSESGDGRVHQRRAPEDAARRLREAAMTGTARRSFDSEFGAGRGRVGRARAGST